MWNDESGYNNTVHTSRRKRRPLSSNSNSLRDSPASDRHSDCGTAIMHVKCAKNEELVKLLSVTTHILLLQDSLVGCAGGLQKEIETASLTGSRYTRRPDCFGSTQKNDSVVLLHFKASVLGVTRRVVPEVRICVWLSLRLLARRRTAGLSHFRQALQLRDSYNTCEECEECKM